MLIRAHKLHGHITEWLQDNQHSDILGLTDIEWKQVEYLIELSLPYCQLGNAIAKTKSVTIHNVFPVYDRLFIHLSESIAWLQRKQEPWKRSIVRGLIAAKDKLHKYYSKTYERQGDMAAIATILSPDLKLSAFDNITWEAEWRQIYKDQFIEFYYDNYDEAETQYIGTVPGTNEDDLTAMLRCSRSTNPNVVMDNGEVGQYLTEGLLPSDYSSDQMG